jgi:hypothetical protein
MPYALLGSEAETRLIERNQRMSDTDLFDIVRELMKRVDHLQEESDDRNRRSREAVTAIHAKSLAMYLEVRSWQSAKAWNGKLPQAVIDEWKREWEAFGKPEPTEEQKEAIRDVIRNKSPMEVTPLDIINAAKQSAPIFEVGDLVECTCDVIHKSFGIAAGDQHHVQKTGERQVFVNDHGPFDASRFKLIEKAKKPEPKIAVGDSVQCDEDCVEQNDGVIVVHCGDVRTVEFVDGGFVQLKHTSGKWLASHFTKVDKLESFAGKTSDDSDLITAKWLLRIGFVRCGEKEFRSPNPAGDNALPLRIESFWEGEWTIKGFELDYLRTRRDIRLFAELMRIELKESK